MPGTKPKVDGAEIQQPKEQTKKKEKKKKKSFYWKKYTNFTGPCKSYAPKICDKEWSNHRDKNNSTRAPDLSKLKLITHVTIVFFFSLGDRTCNTINLYAMPHDGSYF